MNKSVLAVAAASLMTIIGTGASHRTPPSPAVVPAPRVATQIDEDVRSALERNAEAPSLLEWRQSGFTPTDVVANVLSLHDSEAISALCRAHGALPAGDLSLFAEELRGAAASRTLPCADELTRVIEHHWDTERAALAMNRADDAAIPTARRLVVPGEPIALRPGEVALTFEEELRPRATREILAALAARDVRATFFVDGSAGGVPASVGARAELVREIVRAGHGVGALPSEYRDLPALPIKDAEDRIGRGVRWVSSDAGGVSLFRFPYGESTAPLEDYARAHRLATVPWTVDSDDWRTRDPRAIVERVIARLARERAGVVRFQAGLEQTAVALPRLLDALRAGGYTAVVFNAS